MFKMRHIADNVRRMLTTSTRGLRLFDERERKPLALFDPPFFSRNLSNRSKYDPRIATPKKERSR